MDLTFQSTKEFRERYAEILCKKWSYAAFEAAFHLVHDQLSAAGLQLREEERQVEEAPGFYPIPPNASAFLKEHLENLNYTLKLQHEATEEQRFRKRADKALQFRCLSTALLLSFPAWPPNVLTQRIHIQGSTRLFDDSRSSLYLLTIHELLPRVQAKGWNALVNLLLQALYVHVSIAWSHDVAHQSFLLAEFCDFVGDTEGAANALQAAFRATDPAAHDYMTTAFAYWSYLIDHHEHEKAVDFALGVYRHAPQRWLSDAEDLVRESFRQQSGRT